MGGLLIDLLARGLLFWSGLAHAPTRASGFNHDARLWSAIELTCPSDGPLDYKRMSYTTRASDQH